MTGFQLRRILNLEAARVVVQAVLGFEDEVAVGVGQVGGGRAACVGVELNHQRVARLAVLSSQAFDHRDEVVQTGFWIGVQQRHRNQQLAVAIECPREHCSAQHAVGLERIDVVATARVGAIQSVDEQPCFSLKQGHIGIGCARDHDRLRGCVDCRRARPIEQSDRRCSRRSLGNDREAVADVAVVEQAAGDGGAVFEGHGDGAADQLETRDRAGLIRPRRRAALDADRVDIQPECQRFTRLEAVEVHGQPVEATLIRVREVVGDDPGRRVAAGVWSEALRGRIASGAVGIEDDFRQQGRGDVETHLCDWHITGVGDVEGLIAEGGPVQTSGVHQDFGRTRLSGDDLGDQLQRGRGEILILVEPESVQPRTQRQREAVGRLACVLDRVRCQQRQEVLADLGLVINRAAIQRRDSSFDIGLGRNRVADLNAEEGRV